MCVMLIELYNRITERKKHIIEMKKSIMAKMGMLLVVFAMSACGDSEEDKVCDVAREFADAYYNLNIRKAQAYCTRELVPIMNFRHHNLTDRDIAYRKSKGRAKVRIVNCEITDNSLAYVNVEISNLMLVNYMTEELSIVPCDTVELTIVKEIDKVWRIRDPM